MYKSALLNRISSNPMYLRLLKDLKAFIHSRVRRYGLEVVRYPRHDLIDDGYRDILARVAPYTMTSPERIGALCDAVRYADSNGIPGDIVECGVWRGGSMMAAILASAPSSVAGRHFHLFDTFDGMTPPGEEDIYASGEPARELLRTSSKCDSRSVWCNAPLDEVTTAVMSTGCDRNRIHFIKGPVEQTLPANAPKSIAILRLDTDWYESTRHALECLYPRVVHGGVIIFDDYGSWRGAKRAIDEYIAANAIQIMLTRIDSSSRLGIKAIGDQSRLHIYGSVTS